MSAPPEGAPVLEVRGLSVRYTRAGWLREQATAALHGVDLTIGAGEAVAVVGPSGSGKSTLARAVLRLVPATGSVRLCGTELVGLSGARLRAARRPMQVVFQDPASSLDPRWSVERLVGEALFDQPRGAAERIATALQRVGVPADLYARRPGQLSGGQRQRVALARALVAEPRLLVLDEPLTALDATLQVQVLDLLAAVRDAGVALLFIAHGLAAVARLAQRVVVLDRGRVVETGPTAAVLSAPQHPATRALVAAVPRWPDASGALDDPASTACGEGQEKPP